MLKYHYIAPTYKLDATVPTVDSSDGKESIFSGAIDKIAKQKDGTAIIVSASWIVPSVYPPDPQQSQGDDAKFTRSLLAHSCRCTDCKCYLCCQGDCSDYPYSGSSSDEYGSNDGTDNGSTDGGSDGESGSDSNTDNDGTYPCYSWVGIDCTTTQNGLRAGTRSEVTVENGNIVGHSATFWVQWVGETSDITNIPVQPGDLVSVLLTCDVGDTYPSVVITNDSARVGTTSSSTSKTTVAGKSAEWLMQGPLSTAGNPLPYPHLGATVFYNVIADVGDTVVETLANATLVKDTDEGWDAAIVSDILMVYGEGYGPS